MEKTLILIKPDAVMRGLIGEVLRRYERRGLAIVGLKRLQMTPEMAEHHYQEHAGKDFLPQLIQYMTSGPIVAAIVEGERAIAAVRSVNGCTDPVKAQAGTIRGDFGLNVTCNLVHASDSTESAAREIALFFAD